MTAFLPTLRSVAAKAAKMIEDSLYRDLTRLMFAFDEAEGLVCKILALDSVHAQLRKMVAMGDVESAEMLVESTHSSTSWSASSSVWIRRERWGLSCSAGGGRCHDHGGEAHRPA